MDIYPLLDILIHTTSINFGIQGMKILDIWMLDMQKFPTLFSNNGILQIENSAGIEYAYRY
jgi:hypothetical protein